jgi:hypothetical protein
MVSIGSVLSNSTPFATGYLGNPGLYNIVAKMQGN